MSFSLSLQEIEVSAFGLGVGYSRLKATDARLCLVNSVLCFGFVLLLFVSSE